MRNHYTEFHNIAMVSLEVILVSISTSVRNFYG